MPTLSSRHITYFIPLSLSSVLQNLPHPYTWLIILLLTLWETESFCKELCKLPLQQTSPSCILCPPVTVSQEKQLRTLFQGLSYCYILSSLAYLKTYYLLNYLLFPLCHQFPPSVYIMFIKTRFRLFFHLKNTILRPQAALTFASLFLLPFVGKLLKIVTFTHCLWFLSLTFFLTSQPSFHHHHSSTPLVSASNDIRATKSNAWSSPLTLLDS